MTDEELQIAVAEALGYNQIEMVDIDAGGARHTYLGWVNKSLSDFEVNLPYFLDDSNYEVNLPDYPNDMNACLELLKEMMDNGSLLKIYGLPNVEDTFYVSIYNAQTRELITNMMSESLPIAICKAYLAWKEGQK